jgi:hypothetical protein
MSAYLFTGWTSHFKAGQLGNSCVSLITYGGELERANDYFAQWLLALNLNHSGDPVPSKVEQIVVTPVLEQLFTEEGLVSINWAQVCEEAARASDADAEDLFEQGHWADCDALVSPDDLSSDIESLRETLPDDVRSGLNWSGGRQHIFLVSALSPPAPQSEAEDLEDSDQEEASSADQHGDGWTTIRLNDRTAAFPELAPRDGVFVVRARNSTVAAWLYRRQAAVTPLARNRIRVDHWCGAEKIDDPPST